MPGQSLARGLGGPLLTGILLARGLGGPLLTGMLLARGLGGPLLTGMPLTRGLGGPLLTRMLLTRGRPQRCSSGLQARGAEARDGAQAVSMAAPNTPPLSPNAWRTMRVCIASLKTCRDASSTPAV